MELHLSENKLNIVTLSSVINVVGKSLTHLYLIYINELEGSLPNIFQSLCKFKELYLSFNKFSGQLSDNMQQLRCSQNGLKSLDLSNNPFSSGPLPDFSEFSSLTKISL